ncbi:MAG: class I SAM-dependent methyltransferase [Candidatus Binatia bacterium]
MKQEHHKKSHFHDHQHAAEFDQRAAKSEIRGQLAIRLIEMLKLGGEEWILDLATGTGRFARPVSQRLGGGRIVGLDEALAMLRVSRENKHEAIPSYIQTAGDAESLPFRIGVFDRAFVCFSLHHFGRPASVAREMLRVLKPGGRFVVLDPVLAEPRDALDRALDNKVNQVFRRTHGENFRFHSAEGIRSLLSGAGFRIARLDLPRFSFDQDGMEGIPTGRHWLEVAEELADENAELAHRFQENYFRWKRQGEKVHVQGSFAYALVCGEKS